MDVDWWMTWRGVDFPFVCVPGLWSCARSSRFELLGSDPLLVQRSDVRRVLHITVERIFDRRDAYVYGS